MKILVILFALTLTSGAKAQSLFFDMNIVKELNSITNSQEAEKSLQAFLETSEVMKVEQPPEKMKMSSTLEKALFIVIQNYFEEIYQCEKPRANNFEGRFKAYNARQKKYAEKFKDELSRSHNSIAALGFSPKAAVLLNHFIIEKDSALYGLVAFLMQETLLQPDVEALYSHYQFSSKFTAGLVFMKIWQDDPRKDNLWKYYVRQLLKDTPLRSLAERFYEMMD